MPQTPTQQWSKEMPPWLQSSIQALPPAPQTPLRWMVPITLLSLETEIAPIKSTRLVKQTLLLCCHWLLTQNWRGVARAGGGACLTGAAWAWDQCPGLSCKGKRLYLMRHGIPQAQEGGSAAEQPEWVTDVQPCISFHHPTNTWSCQRHFFFPETFLLSPF